MLGDNLVMDWHNIRVGGGEEVTLPVTSCWGKRDELN